MSKCAVVGSRSFNDYAALEKIISELNISEIISGGAKGADSLAEQYADINNIKCTIYKANWAKFGRAAGMIRNTDIIEKSDIVIAFWDGKSKGTADSIKKAQKLNKELTIVRI